MTLTEVFQKIKEEMAIYCKNDLEKEYLKSCFKSTNCSYFVIFPYLKKKTALCYMLTLKDSSYSRTERIHVIETKGGKTGFKQNANIILTVDLQFGNVKTYPDGKLDDELLLDIFKKCANVARQKKETYIFFDWGGKPVSQAISFKETISIDLYKLNNEESFQILFNNIKKLLAKMISDFDSVILKALGALNYSNKIEEPKKLNLKIEPKNTKDLLDDFFGD